MNERKPDSSLARAAGFTLVELMVVVLVISILAAVAYPGYRNQVVKTHRSAAKACLMQYSQLVERYYTTNLTYVDADDLEPGCADEADVVNNYVFTADTLTATTYRVVATPTEAFAARDTQCGALRINQAGQRTVSSGTPEDCW